MPPTGALLDHPGHTTIEPFLEQNPGHKGRDAKAEVHHLAVDELERGAAGDHLLQTPVGQFKLSDGPAQLAADGWVVFRLGRLPLVGNDDDPVDQGAGNSHLLRRERPGRGQTFHLGDDDPAVVPRRQCLIESAEIRAFMLRRDVAQLVGGRAANDGDVDRDGPVMEPLVTIELDNRARSLPRSRGSCGRPAAADRRTCRVRLSLARRGDPPRRPRACGTGLHSAGCRPRSGRRRSAARFLVKACSRDRWDSCRR